MSFVAFAATDKKAGEESSHLVIAFFSNLRGNVAPCGCPSNPLGGMARMATYVKEARKQGNMLLLCAGDVLGGTGTEERWKGDTALAALREMGCDALMPGEMEQAQGTEWGKEQAKRYPFVMTNDQLTMSNVQAPKPNPLSRIVYKEFRLSGQTKPLKVAIVGINDQFPMTNVQSQNPKPETQNPKPPTLNPQPLARLVADARKQADFVIVLAHVGMDGATRLAKEVAGIDLIIVGHAPQTAMPRPMLVGKTLIISNGDKGKSVGELRLTFTPGGRTTKDEGRKTKASASVRRPSSVVSEKSWQLASYHSRLVPLSSQFADDSKVAALIMDYKRKVADAVAAGQKIAPERVIHVAEENANSRRFVGVSGCASCHAQQVSQWMKSEHAKAVESLKRKDGGLDALRPECLSCHALGYGIPSGYQGEGRTSHLAGVQCESCHGMGSEHAAAPKEKAKTTISRGKGAALCRTCHDKDNSPQFKYETYLEKIKHW